MAVNGNYGANPNYPSSYRQLSYKQTSPVTPDAHQKWVAQVIMHLNEVTSEDYVQANALWDVLGRTPGQQDNYVHNIAVHLNAAREDTRKRTYEMFSKVNPVLGSRIRKETEALV
ncbi:hypothetical protein V500_01094 [Pseudogymnoascus sp. VKM F-4518 (FW-2643)]|nr:hypothetical protein V500_01094 [Pseudogymnoascus sp. VKM F-4518 (FW-2643)]